MQSLQCSFVVTKTEIGKPSQKLLVELRINIINFVAWQDIHPISDAQAASEHVPGLC